MPKAKMLPSGNWRVQVFIGYKINDSGKKTKCYKSFTHPSKTEAEYLAVQYKRENDDIATVYDITVREAMNNYVKSRTNILSPTTIQGYEQIIRNHMKNIMDIKINKLTQQQIQQAINADAKNLSAKTIKNAHGLLSAVLKLYRPNLRLTTSMPKEKKKLKELPSPQKLFDAVKGTKIELPVLLAMWLSFSMSEIRGIKKSDIKDGVLTLNRSIVDIKGKPIEKNEMKEYERTRKLEIPPYIMSLIEKCEGEYITTLTGQAIYKRWTRLLKKNGIPHITFHDLRHVNASVMHLLDIPDKYAMERGGWKTDKTMKAVYQNVFSDERINVDKKINEYFEGFIQNEDTVSHEISHE
ncbi:MAG: site-specific integrase [Christensenellales bacterium]|jgi:integrase